MDTKPIDHTYIYRYTTTTIVKDGPPVLVGPTTMESSRIDYADYDRFEHLPGACRGEEIRKEFEAYKEWERQHGRPKIKRFLVLYDASGNVIEERPISQDPVIGECIIVEDLPDNCRFIRYKAVVAVG
jgi:hypothetical protein